MAEVQSTQKERVKRGLCGVCRMPCKAGAKQCTACRLNEPGRKRLERESARQRLLSRQCVRCGNSVNSLDKRQKTCGCKVQKIEVACCVCGRSKFQYPRQVRANTCCTMRCQRVFAARCKVASEINFAARSAKRKEIEQKARSMARRQQSTAFRFWKLVDSVTFDEAISNRWQSKCYAANAQLGKRLVLSSRNMPNKRRTFNEVSAKAFRKTYSELDQWSRKCYSTAKNMKWRGRLRGVKLSSCLHIDSSSRQPKQLTLWV